MTKGKEKIFAGEYLSAFEDLQMADNAYRSAMQIGRSDQETYKRECILWSLYIQWEAPRKEESLNRALENTLSSCDNALRVNPDDSKAIR